MLAVVNEHAARHCPHWPEEADRSTWPRSRLALAHLVESQRFDLAMGLLILFNVILMVIEADASADCAAHGSGICEPPGVVQSFNHILLGLYTVEAALRFYVYRSAFLCSAWNNLDLFIVVTGFVDLILISGSVVVSNLQVLRVFRILRLLRAVRLLALFPELQTMFHGMACAMKAMFWGFMLILLMLGVWSLLTVELLSVKNKPDGFPEVCDEAFSSVLKATHFFFQLIVAGEGWGECIRPLVHAHPQTFLLFASVMVTMQLGFMNLILTVIVQEVANARENDIKQRLKEKKAHEQECLERWEDIVCQIDRDDSGTISKEELLTSFNEQEEVQHFLELLDIDRRELEKLFDLMDADHSNDVSYTEFFDTLRKAQSQDMRTTLFTLRLQVSQISDSVQRQVKNAIVESFQDVEKPARHKQVEQKLASEREDILSGVRIQLEHMQLEDRLEKMSQGISGNTARLSQNTELLEAALSRLGLDGEVRVQAPADAPADGPAKKKARSEVGRSRADVSASPWACSSTPPCSS